MAFGESAIIFELVTFDSAASIRLNLRSPRGRVKLVVIAHKDNSRRAAIRAPEQNRADGLENEIRQP
jgi:hypothetical protein